MREGAQVRLSGYLYDYVGVGELHGSLGKSHREFTALQVGDVWGEQLEIDSCLYDYDMKR